MKNTNYLYKYTDENGIVSILEGEALKWGDPRYFNDEYELKIMPTVYTKNSKKLIKKSDVRKIFFSNIKEKKMKIISFTKNDNYSFMWNKYAQKHKGCMLEFSKEFEFSVGKDIQYIIGDRKVQLDKKFDISNAKEIGFLLMDKIIYSKEYKWHKENEYRVVHPNLDSEDGKDYSLVKFKKESLLSVTLGKNMEQSIALKVIKLLREKYPSTKIINLSQYTV